MPETELIGRGDALSAVESRLAALPRQGSALVLRGESGSGRSALLAAIATRAQARGLRCLTAPALEQLRLAHPGDTLRSGAAVLAHLPSSVLLLDDFEALEPATRRLALFIARRCATARVLVVAAMREGPPLEFPELRLEPLSDEAAGTLLDREAPELPLALRRRVIETAQGNPLGLIELAAAGVADELLAATTPRLSDRLIRSLADALPELRPETRRALLIAAIEPEAPLAVVLDAAGTTPDAVAVAAPVAEIADGRLRFRRDLVRAFVAQSASKDERAAVHAALAERLAEPLRTWHRAATASRPDEALAGALETAARRARARGDLVAAAAGFARAAELTARPDPRALRLAAAAACAFDLGLTRAARDLLARAQALDLGRAARTLVDLQGPVLDGTWTSAATIRDTIARVAAVEEHGDRSAAIDVLIQLALECWLGTPDAATRDAFVEAAERVGRGDPRALAITALAEPDRSAPAIAARLREVRAADVDDPLLALKLAVAANAVNDWRQARRLLAPAIAQLRRHRRDGVLASALAHHAWATLHTGDWAFAASGAGEARRLALETGHERSGMSAQLILAQVAALRGEAGHADIERIAVFAAAPPAVSAAVRHIRATLALGEGRHEDAWRELGATFDPVNPTFRRSFRGGWALLDLVESAARSGAAEGGRAVLDAFEPVAGPPGSLLAACAVCARPLVASDADADALFAAALAHDLSGWPYVRARTLLSYGRWLRSRRRAAGALTALRVACDELDMLGAHAFADRARDELRALGATQGTPAPRARVDLTPQEQLIAKLAAGGMTNHQIADQLVLSHRTIGSHLYQIFPKLGISSRAQLRAALEGVG